MQQPHTSPEFTLLTRSKAVQGSQCLQRCAEAKIFLECLDISNSRPHPRLTSFSSSGRCRDNRVCGCCASPCISLHLPILSLLRLPLASRQRWAGQWHTLHRRPIQLPDQLKRQAVAGLLQRGCQRRQQGGIRLPVQGVLQQSGQLHQQKLALSAVALHLSAGGGPLNHFMAGMLPGDTWMQQQE